MSASQEESYEIYSTNGAADAFGAHFTTGMRSNMSRPRSQWSRFTRMTRSIMQIQMAWLLAVLTLVLLALTTLYAAQASLTSQKHVVFSSRSDAIFVLRALSELTGVMLAATIATTFESVQWLYVAQKGGVRLADYLALQAGTGIMGLLALAVGREVPNITTRVLSIVRLVSIVLVPVLGVLIMSNVQTKLTFNKVDQLTLPLGFGLASMNITVAQQLSLLTDVLFGATFSTFLTDPNHVVDITPATIRQKSCSQGIDVRGGQTCEQIVFLAAGIDQVGGEVAKTSSFPNADVWLTEDHQGYVLHFTEGDVNWQFDNVTDCRVYYTKKIKLTIGAYMMCSKNITPSSIQARIVSCPYDPMQKSCLGDTSWQSLPGWTTSLNSTFRRASMAYSRLNGTILTHQFIDDQGRDAPIKSSDILQAWDSFLGVGGAANSTMQQVLSMMGLGAGDFLFPGLVSWFLNSVTTIAIENPAAATRGVNALQSLLAIPIYWCQTGMLERDSMVSLPGGDLLKNPDTLNITADVLRGSSIFLAVQQNEIAVGSATLIAYFSLSTFALTLCFVVLSIGMCTKRGKKIPDTSLFPALDFCTACVVTSRDGSLTSRGPFQAMQGHKGNTDMRVLNQVHVELAYSDERSAAAHDPCLEQSYENVYPEIPLPYY